MHHLKTWLYCLFALVVSIAFAENAPDWAWVHRTGAPGYDAAHGVGLDNRGNILVTGQFEGEISFKDQVMSASGSRDSYLAKYSASGEPLWIVQAGGQPLCLSWCLATDAAGNVLMAGFFSDSATFGNTTLTSAGASDIFVAKLDAGGHWLWAVRAGGSEEDIALRIAVDDHDNAYLTGLCSGQAKIGTTVLQSQGNYDVFAAKISPAGEFLWAVNAGGIMADQGFGIDLDSQGNVYLSGIFRDEASFGSTILKSRGRDDAFTAKLDPQGNFVWAVSAGGTLHDRGSDISVSPSDQIWLGGNFADVADFGPYSLASAGSTDIFVAQLDADGNWMWVQSASGAGQNEVMSIQADAFGNAYLSGQFHEQCAFGSTLLTSVDKFDIYVAKISGSGVFQWAQQAGGPGGNNAWDLAVSDPDDVVLAGYVIREASFGALYTENNDQYDGYLARTTGQEQQPESLSEPGIPPQVPASGPDMTPITKDEPQLGEVPPADGLTTPSGADQQTPPDAAIDDDMEPLQPENSITLQTIPKIPDLIPINGTMISRRDKMLSVASYQLGQYEVIQRHFTAIMGYNPSLHKGDDHPVENVSWFEAVEYCNRLSLSEDLRPAYTYKGAGTNPNDWPQGWKNDPANHKNITLFTLGNGYRLPTALEWEFAALGGEHTQGFDYCGGNDLDKLAWYADNSEGRHHAFCLKQPNELSLYDLGGNVWEWVWDMPKQELAESLGVEKDLCRIARGGAWDSPAEDCTPEALICFDPTHKAPNLGFRIGKIK